MRPQAVIEAWFDALHDTDVAARLTFLKLENLDRSLIPRALILSPAFVELVSRGSNSLEASRRAEIKRRSPDIQVLHKTSRTVDLTYSILSGSKLVFCPFDGCWRETNKAIALDAYWFSSEKGDCIILQFCSGMKALPDTAFLFPEHDLVLYFGSALAEDYLMNRIKRLFLSFARNSRALKRHIFGEVKKPLVAVVEMKSPHFGHYVGNTLSGLAQLLPDLATSIDLFISWTVNGFIAPVNRLFPEVADKELVIIEREPELTKFICQRNIFAVFSKDVWFTERLGRLIVDHALRVCPQDELGAIQELRSTCQTIVLFGLRLGNRAWLSQERGFIELARWIVERHGSAGFIIDGISDGTTMGWTHKFMSLADERAVADRMVHAIADFAPCLSTVGKTMGESLVACSTCDWFVAPAGSGMAKYKWIANKPGILISNSTVLDMDNNLGSAIRVFEKFREKTVPSLFLSPTDVTDVPSRKRTGLHHADFEVELPALQELAKALLPSEELAPFGNMAGVPTAGAGYRSRASGPSE